MRKTALLTSTAVALVMCAAVIPSQAQQKGADEKAGPSGMPGGQATGGEQRVQREPGSAEKGRESSQEKGDTQQKKGAQSEPKEKGTAQTPPRDQGTKGAQSEPREKARDKGTAQTPPRDRNEDTKGTAKSDPKEKSTKGGGSDDRPSKGAAQPESKDKSSKGTAETPSRDQKGSAQTQPREPGKAASDKGSRVRLSEQQRISVSQTILKDSGVNRATKVNFSINVGTKIPRSVRLVVLPASVITLVPEYRSYRYFAVDEQICIVDPNTYEIVEVITISGQTAARGGSTTIVLTEEERMIILREVDMRGGSTLALGALTEGADVPRGVQVLVFPGTIVEKVPKLKGFRFFTAENRVAIVDPQGSKVQLVIEDRR